MTERTVADVILLTMVDIRNLEVDTPETRERLASAIASKYRVEGAQLLQDAAHEALANVDKEPEFHAVGSVLLAACSKAVWLLPPSAEVLAEQQAREGNGQS